MLFTSNTVAAVVGVTALLTSKIIAITSTTITLGALLELLPRLQATEGEFKQYSRAGIGMSQHLATQIGQFVSLYREPVLNKMSGVAEHIESAREHLTEASRSAEEAYSEVGVAPPSLEKVITAIEDAISKGKIQTNIDEVAPGVNYFVTLGAGGVSAAITAAIGSIVAKINTQVGKKTVTQVVGRLPVIGIAVTSAEAVIVYKIATEANRIISAGDKLSDAGISLRSALLELDSAVNVAKVRTQSISRLYLLTGTDNEVMNEALHARGFTVESIDVYITFVGMINEQYEGDAVEGISSDVLDKLSTAISDANRLIDKGDHDLVSCPLLAGYYALYRGIYSDYSNALWKKVSSGVWDMETIDRKDESLGLVFLVYSAAVKVPAKGLLNYIEHITDTYYSGPEGMPEAVKAASAQGVFSQGVTDVVLIKELVGFIENKVGTEVVTTTPGPAPVSDPSALDDKAKVMQTRWESRSEKLVNQLTPYLTPWELVSAVSEPATLSKDVYFPEVFDELVSTESTSSSLLSNISDTSEWTRQAAEYLLDGGRKVLVAYRNKYSELAKQAGLAEGALKKLLTAVVNRYSRAETALGDNSAAQRAIERGQYDLALSELIDAVNGLRVFVAYADGGDEGLVETLRSLIDTPVSYTHLTLPTTERV